MYTVHYNGLLLHDPRAAAYMIRDPYVHLAVGEPGSMSFVIDADHPSAEGLSFMTGAVELRDGGQPIFRGRITRDTKNFDLSRSIETEGLLACLNDSIIPPYNYPDDVIDSEDYEAAAAYGNVVQHFLAWVLSQHNAQVTDAQQLHLGTVTVTDANNYISRSCTDYSTAWDVITGKLTGTALGGYLLPRYEDDGTYLDYYADLPLTNVQQVTFGDNLLDLVSEVDASEIYSVILPIGAEGLTIDSLDDGDINSDLVKSGKTIYSRAAVAKYGRITHVMTWGDVTLADNLLTKASAALAAAGMAQTITVRAADLHCEDGSLPSFRVGRYVRQTSAPHGFADVYPLMELEPDILNPGNTQLTLGRTAITQTDLNKAQQAATAEKIDGQIADIKQNSRDITTVTHTTTEQITQVLQTCQALIMQASEQYVQTGDFESYRQEVSTMFAQTASQIEMSFRTVTEQINDVNGDLQNKYNERTKYIRFVDGDIILGEEGNEITLRIEHDKMSFFQSGHEVAWFSNNQFHVTEAEFTTSARIGNFAFVPGSGGNLSFKKVVS